MSLTNPLHFIVKNPSLLAAPANSFGVFMTFKISFLFFRIRFLKVWTCVNMVWWGVCTLYMYGWGVWVGVWECVYC